MFKSIFILMLLFLIRNGSGQTQFTEAEKLQGYKQENGVVFFVFDEKIYSVSPQKGCH